MSNTRPFNVLGLQQVAIGAKNKQGLKNLWCEIFGIDVHNTYKSEKENVNEDILVLGKGHSAVELDLMESIDPEKKPKVFEPALNHIGLWVDDIHAAVKYLGEKGVRFTPGGIRKGAAGHEVTFIHPKANDEFPMSGEGVLIELVQAPPEVIAELKK